MGLFLYIPGIWESVPFCPKSVFTLRARYWVLCPGLSWSLFCLLCYPLQHDAPRFAGLTWTEGASAWATPPLKNRWEASESARDYVALHVWISPPHLVKLQPISPNELFSLPVCVYKKNIKISTNYFYFATLGRVVLAVVILRRIECNNFDDMSIQGPSRGTWNREG